MTSPPRLCFLGGCSQRVISTFSPFSSCYALLDRPSLVIAPILLMPNLSRIHMCLSRLLAAVPALSAFAIVSPHSPRIDTLRSHPLVVGSAEARDQVQADATLRDAPGRGMYIQRTGNTTPTADLCLFPLTVPLLPVRSLYISLVASERATPLVCPSSASRRPTFRLSV